MAHGLGHYGIEQSPSHAEGPETDHEPNDFVAANPHDYSLELLRTARARRAQLGILVRYQLEVNSRTWGVARHIHVHCTAPLDIQHVKEGFK